ncbi:MAG: DNA-binding protein [Bacilli bacterium]|nr:DNA-binding protein [Bacilli bacterium]
MEKIEKTIRYTKLFNLYSGLLSDAQKDILYDYFFLDLSISEISENKGISRAAVEDALSKGTKKLDSFENSVKSLEKSEKIRSKVEELSKLAANEEEKKIINELMEELDNGI